MNIVRLYSYLACASYEFNAFQNLMITIMLKLDSHDNVWAQLMVKGYVQSMQKFICSNFLSPLISEVDHFCACREPVILGSLPDSNGQCR